MKPESDFNLSAIVLKDTPTGLQRLMNCKYQEVLVRTIWHSR